MAEQTGVVADVHGNRPALEAVLDEFDDRGIETVYCAGDIVGILGWNQWTVETVRDRCEQSVFGNHDSRIRPDFAYTPSFPAARDEHRIVTEQLDEDHVGWLSELPDRIDTDQYVLAHARPFYQRDPGYPCHGFAQGDRGIMPKDFTRIGPHLDDRVALLGHTHEQHAVDCSKFEGQSGLVLNPGSVGVPWYSSAEYAIVDLETHDYELCSVEYDNCRVEDRFDEMGLEVGQYSSGSNRFQNA